MENAVAARNAALDARKSVMRVGFGASVLARGVAEGGVDGIGSYTRELFHCLGAYPGLDLRPYVFDGPLPPGFPTTWPAGRFPAQALIALATGCSFLQLQHRMPQLDLLHATDHHIPRVRRVPVVATLMDAIPLSHPEWVSYKFKRLTNELWRRSAHWAQHVITISESSRAEVAEHFRIPLERISVTPLGVAASWFNCPSAEERNRVSNKYQLPEQFFLNVGTLQPRKNIGRLIAAHGMLAPAMQREIPLVVVGKSGWGCEAEVAQLQAGGIEGAGGKSLRWLSYVSEADLLPLVSLATAMAFPSLHEGFGLPVLEAFAAGVPVVSSNTTSIPEVANDAALLVNPIDTAAIAEAMASVACDSRLSSMLRSRGLLRAQQFTWEETARKSAAIYRQVAGS
jgi:glycosyltransferase involved in cell wall biosynthesis